MKRARFTEEQIIAVLKEAEAGAKTGDLARRRGVSEATIYNWKLSTADWRCPRPSGYPSPSRWLSNISRNITKISA